MFKTKILISATLALFSLSASAADPFKGFYFGVGAGVSQNSVTEDHEFVGISNVKEDDGGAGYKAYLGYSFGLLGVEVGYFDFGRATVTGTIGGAPSKDEFSAKSLAVSLAGNFPVTESVAFHAKLGLASTESDYKCISFCPSGANSSKNAVTPIFGLGLSYAFTKNLAVRADWEGTTGVKYDYFGDEMDVSAGLFSMSLEGRF